MEEKKKVYVICSRTLKELHDSVKDMDTYETLTLCEYNVDRSDMSEAQKDVQNSNHWYKERSQEFRVGETQIYDVAKKLAIKKILDGCKKDIKRSIFEELYNTDVKVIAWIVERNGYDDLDTSSEFGTKDEWGNENKYEYLNDLDEFRKKLEKVKYKNSFSSQVGDYVLLEKLSVIVRAYKFNDIDKKIMRLVNKAVKEELTYCLKKDEVIIPQEYIDKGEEGIKEWREIKASKNKNNSIEKKILRQAVNDKKQYAFDAMRRIMATIATIDINWSMPFLDIDGRWNKQRTSKLINSILDSKNPQFYIDITEEEIINKFKEYWKDILTKAINNVDEVPVKEGNK